MIITLQNKDEFVYSYIQFQVVDEESRLDNNGKYLFINGFWIHPSKRGNFRDILNLFIHELLLHPTTQRVEEVYYERDNGKKVRCLAYRYIRKLYHNKLIIGDRNVTRETTNSTILDANCQANS
jgi:hypothetical protein